ncbi:MAG: membrane-spanning protein [Bacillota bacterium]|nr:membrane-spanning protein [Bacillota bacterium]
MKKKIINILSLTFILFLMVLFFYYFKKSDSSRWPVALGGVGVCALPLLLRKNNPFPLQIVLGYYLLVFCTTFLGSIASFYYRFEWWDSAVHFYKGILVGFIAITIFKLFISTSIRKNISKWMLFLFILSFTDLTAVLWEIYEFFLDTFFTDTMQLGGNKDTMMDLIFGTLGSFLVSIYSIFRKDKI